MTRTTLCLAQGVALPSPIGMPPARLPVIYRSACSQEWANYQFTRSQKELPMDDDKMTFGRFRGMPVSAVPVEYLAWANAKLRNPPSSILHELHRRAAGGNNREALEAQAAITSRAYRPERKRPRKGWRGVLDSMP
jgi:hypothetical protein